MRQAELRAKREEITLLKNPVLVLRLFLEVLSGLLVRFSQAVYRHRTSVVLPIVALLLLLLVGKRVPGPHTGALQELEASASFVLWWCGACPMRHAPRGAAADGARSPHPLSRRVGLGVLSSIGLGTGAHTGLLFLFPHIYKALPFPLLSPQPTRPTTASRAEPPAPAPTRRAGVQIRAAVRLAAV